MPGRRLQWVVVTLMAAGVSAVVAAGAFATVAPTKTTATKAAATVTPDERLYREFCGQCHALAQALSAGFGNANGLGENGGPSFNNLRVPYAQSIIAVTEPTGGHEAVSTKITPKQLNEVATYIAAVTKHHPILATSTDG
jgi:mono/diheme cytochrome c family protein